MLVLCGSQRPVPETQIPLVCRKNSIEPLSKSFSESLWPDLDRFMSRSGSIDSYLQASEAWPYHDEVNYDELEGSEERWKCFTRGYRPLHLAVHLVAPSFVISALVERGEQLEAKDSNGKTALHIAAEIDGETSTLQALLAHGSDVAAIDNIGDTPLAGAVV